MEFSASSKVKRKNKNSGIVPQQSDGSPNHKLLKKRSKHLEKAPHLVEEWDNESKEDEAHVDNANKTKKRKRKDAESNGQDIQAPKKKRKNRTEFADPREDSTLNGQSRKALEYAFMQMNKPTKWKFNKARQNWLIRNLWSPEALPETYFPLTLKYLSKVQGGSRTKLIEEAQRILCPEETTPEPEKPPAPKIVKFSEPGIETITLKVKPTPGPLISTNLTPGPPLDSETISVTNEHEPSPVVAKVNKSSVLVEIKKMRAQKLLEML